MYYYLRFFLNQIIHAHNIIKPYINKTPVLKSESLNKIFNAINNWDGLEENAYDPKKNKIQYNKNLLQNKKLTLILNLILRRLLNLLLNNNKSCNH